MKHKIRNILHSINFQSAAFSFSVKEKAMPCDSSKKWQKTHIRKQLLLTYCVNTPVSSKLKCYFSWSLLGWIFGNSWCRTSFGLEAIPLTQSGATKGISKVDNRKHEWTDTFGTALQHCVFFTQFGKLSLNAWCPRRLISILAHARWLCNIQFIAQSYLTSHDPTLTGSEFATQRQRQYVFPITLKLYVYVQDKVHQATKTDDSKIIC